MRGEKVKHVVLLLLVLFLFLFSFRVTQSVPEMSLFLVKIRGKNLFLLFLRLLRTTLIVSLLKALKFRC